MINLYSILNTRYFIIPENQRGFSWLTINFVELVSDLILIKKKGHYLGPIIVTRDRTNGEIVDDDGTNLLKYILEDGQQRLTAFFFLIRALQLRLKELDGTETIEQQELGKLIFYKKGEIKLRLQNTNDDLDACFSNLMRNSPPIPRDETAPMKAMIEAFDWCTKYYSDKARDECIQWKNRFMNQSKFIIVDLDSEGVDRYLTFDAINSRGLPLSQFDKIKNFCILIDNIHNLSLSPGTLWYQTLQKLEYFSVSHRSDEESFITELFNVFHDKRVSQGDIHQEFVNKYRPLLESKDPVLIGDFISFITIWPKYASSYGLMSTKKKVAFYGNECTKKAGTWLDCLDNLGLPTITRPILVVSHMTMSDSEFEVIARVCEIYTFRLYAALGRRKDMNATKIVNLANNILRNSKDIDYARSEFCEWLSKMATLSVVIHKISNGEAKYSFDSNVSGWPYCYYFLYEYEVDISPAGVTPRRWGTSKEEKINTQEHILPQEHRDRSWWEKQWPDEASAEKYKHRLGNLVLTTGNSVLGRKPIDKKLNDPTSTYDYQSDNATNSEKKICIYTDGIEWKKHNILKRELDLLKFAVKRWSIPCCSDNVNIFLPEAFMEIDEEFMPVSFKDCYPKSSEDEQEMIDQDEDETYDEGEITPNDKI
ncbi:DUF262 domain-containing protein [Desulfobacula sp.]|uniref:GmrSD restriction endonuclease domain-containing protein n=1 Tax=Desulfobacula sp. TaxID=2593537 RepID=UPI001EB0B132|nr:DUF262 domain-containing protein [Desulfobacula sp.]